ncbi:amino acid adenylation domain-containing protein [Streptomyces caelestis]|uniref:non-ribosomal peptide synthetase n=1 Tax=Streptomyces caelestis TaxID=36816 RepID=UPI00380EB043
MSELARRLRRVPLERRVKFLELLKGENAPKAQDGPVPRARDATARQDTAPLSYAQNTLWFLDRLSPGVRAYNLIIAFWVDGALDVAALERALGLVVARHEALRTSLRDLPEGPRQVIEAEVPVTLATVPVPGADPDERSARARELAEEAVREPFDLGAGPLWRARLLQTEPSRHLFAFVVHHAVFDAASSEVVTGELLELYLSLTQGRPATFADLRVQYADFAIWQRETLSGRRLDELERFWSERLRGAPVLELPTDLPRPVEFTYRGTEAAGPIPGEVIDGVHRLARAMGVTPYPVYLAVFAELLRRYTAQEDLVVGCSTSIRGQLELQGLVGFFVNMLALRVDASGTPTFRTLVTRADSVLRDSLAHLDLPFERVVQATSPTRDPSRSPLVQVAFLMPQQPWEVTAPGLGIELEEPATGTSKFDMTWQVREAGDDSSLTVEYCTDLYTADTLDAMITHYVRLLTALVEEPDRVVGDLDMLSPDEHAQLLAHGSGPRRDFGPATVHGRFAEQAAGTPDAVAVVHGDDSIRYAELDAAANRLAHALRERGADTGGLVALCLPRGIDYVTAVLATLKAGAAFVPLDPQAPPDRIAGLLDDAKPSVVVSRSPEAAALPAHAPVLLLDELTDSPAARPAAAPEAAAGPDDLAYVLYTSGSTGRPKGVLIEHHSVTSFVAAVGELFAMNEADRVLGYAACTFDVSVFEMFGALLHGARLHIASDADRLDVDRLQALLETAGITVMDMPPAVMALLDPDRLGSLRIAFVGGEAFPGDLVNRWNTVCRFFNGYGPTECTVTMVVQECAGHWDTSPPIGLPIADHVAHVLDEHLRPVPYGVAGELVIGGAGLARGYLNQPALTREKFVADPFGTAPGGRLYRTGDLVRRLRNGALVFLGRLDRQIKVRGVRIEPGEIEAVLAAHPDVRQVQVEAWTDPHGTNRLVAYVVRDEQAEVSAQELRAFVADKMPATMVPQHVVQLPEFPLTSSGKIDTRALNTSDILGGVDPGTATAPRTEMERILAEDLFLPMLRNEVVDVTANFFEMGGSSLQAAQLISGIRRRFGTEISTADFFRDPTIEGLAVVVEQRRAAALDDASLLDMIEQMSEEDVARLTASDKGEAG